jgi:hypothetical protein
MSRELYIYSGTNAPALRSDLEEAFEVIGWQYRLFEDLDAFRPAEGPSIQSCTVLGWLDDDKIAAKVGKAIAKRDLDLLAELAEAEEVAVVDVDFEHPFDADPEMIDELRQNAVDKEIVDRIAAANVCYSVRTSASRNDLAFDLQNIVWSALGVALYGVLEDPEEGTFEDASREEGEDEDRL